MPASGTLTSPRMDGTENFCGSAIDRGGWRLLILVLDFGGQYAQLIARRVRECRVYSEMIPYDTPVEEIRAKNPEGIILSGGPNSVYEEGAPRTEPDLFDLGVPLLGICYGMQLMALVEGGEVGAVQIREYGRSDLVVKGHEGLFSGTPDEQKAWTSHGDAVLSVPEGFEVTAETLSVPIIAFEDRERRHFGVQFHPEVRHTEYGMEILKNFLYEACGCKPEWTPVNIITDAVERIRAQVGEAFGENSDVPLVHVDSKGRFLDKLANVTDPEAKRKIIGEEFIRTFEEEAGKLEDAKFLVQGTLYSDVIESGTRDAARIKSHHNVGGLPEVMDLDLVEPLRNLFKDEVRVVAAELGMPERLVWRQPFPGPGLAIRVIGDVTAERLGILRKTDAVLQDGIRKAGLYRELWQSFAVLPAIHSVGVQGDERTYAHPIVIRAVTSEDAMTADWARLPYDLLERTSNRIINEVPGVNRVALDITSKPPGTIEWE